jgi:hypothetical protein
MPAAITPRGRASSTNPQASRLNLLKNLKSTPQRKVEWRRT